MHPFLSLVGLVHRRMGASLLRLAVKSLIYCMSDIGNCNSSCCFIAMKCHSDKHWRGETEKR